MSLHSRTDYTKGALDESAVADGPWALLEQWVKEAVDAGISDPTAFTLNTLDAKGFPHGRIVLLRDTRDEQLVFYTNYSSEKGQDVERLGKAGATFFWPHAERQIRVRGTVAPRVGGGIGHLFRIASAGKPTRGLVLTAKHGSGQPKTA